MESWITRINEAMDYIEAHLSEEITPQQLAQIACCSPFHFQRMFAYMADVPLAEYVRRRRMSLAAVDLQNGMTVLDAALKYGYASPTAFNRAFQSVHGAPPSAAQKGGSTLKSFPPVRFHLTVSGGEELSYRVEEHGPWRVVGLGAPLSNRLEENFAVVPGLFERAAKENVLPRLFALMDGQPRGLLGVSACVGEDRWRYLIGTASGAQAPEPFEALEIPEATWAIFPGRGPASAIQALEKRIVLEWLPTSGYEYADAPDVEVYLNADPQDACFEVWIPVKKAAGR